ncbi:hypothetical protein EUGRSUZ_E01870, partial [Eucalyptus grandis]
MVALSFFHWAIGSDNFRHFMRFYIVCAASLIGNGNSERANEVMQCLVKSFAEIGRLKEAIDMALEMQKQGLVPTTRLMNFAMEVAIGRGFLDYAQNVFDYLSERGVCPDPNSYKLMVVAYCRMGSILEADAWLRKLIDRDFVIDNATLTLITNSFCEKGFMADKGLAPNVLNYTSLINGLCKKGSIKQGFELLEEMVRKGWKPNVYTHTALIDGLCKKGWSDKAFRLFLKLVRSENYKPNVLTYTAMISGYCRKNKLNRAEMLSGRMQEQGLIPNTNTYTTLIDGHCKGGNFGRAYELMGIMTDAGFSPNICTYNALIDGLCKRGSGLEADLFTYSILINEQCKRASIEEALALLSRMIKLAEQPDIHTYTIMISALCKQKRMKESEKIFEEAIRLGLVPTKKTYTSMIGGFCRDGNANLAIKIFHRMSDHGCLPDSITYCALISGLCKESRLKEARRLYDSMLDKGLTPCEVTRLTLAYEYCKKDESANALLILERLENKLWIRTVKTLETRVDRVTLAAFMTACYESNKYALLSDLTKRIREGNAATLNL